MNLFFTCIGVNKYDTLIDMTILHKLQKGYCLASSLSLHITCNKLDCHVVENVLYKYISINTERFNLFFTSVWSKSDKEAEES